MKHALDDGMLGAWQWVVIDHAEAQSLDRDLFGAVLREQHERELWRTCSYLPHGLQTRGGSRYKNDLASSESSIICELIGSMAIGDRQAMLRKPAAP
jgi:hypothetical protein